MAVPIKLTVWGGLPEASAATLSVAVLGPVTVGWKVMLMVQVEPALTEPQSLVWLKSALLLPVNVMPLIKRAEAPVFLRVTDCAALVVPTFCAEKVSNAGAK